MDRILIDICKQLNGIRIEIATLTKTLKEINDSDEISKKSYGDNFGVEMADLARAIKELKERDDSDELSKKAYRNNFDTVNIMHTDSSSREST